MRNLTGPTRHHQLIVQQAGDTYWQGWAAPTTRTEVDEQTRQAKLDGWLTKVISLHTTNRGEWSVAAGGKIKR